MTKIGIIHYLWNESSSGVNTVVGNNVEGLKELFPDIEPVFISDSASKEVFNGYEKRKINMRRKDFHKRLLKKTKDLDAILIENPFRQLREYPMAPMEFKKFADSFDGKIVYRHHDVNEGLKEVVPEKGNVTHVTLVQPTVNQLGQWYKIPVEILKNSVICENFYKTNPEKDEALLQEFLKQEIVQKGEKVIAVPNRIVDRKNIEESMLITKMLNTLYEDQYRLIVTTSILENEPNNIIQARYQRMLEEFAEKHKIKVSLGKVSKIIDGKNFNVGNFYHISELALTTSAKEGFGYMFVEPWVADTPLIGRYIEHVVPDFKKNRLDMVHLYDNDVLEDGLDFEKRFSYFDSILSDKSMVYDLISRMELPGRIEYAKQVLEKNKQAVKDNYNHVKIARELANYLGI